MLAARRGRVNRDVGGTHPEEGEDRDHLGRHYAYVTEAELETWLGALGMEIVSRRTSLKQGCAGTDDPCIDMIAIKPADG